MMFRWPGCLVFALPSIAVLAKLATPCTLL
jgi:hypothetical protein